MNKLLLLVFLGLAMIAIAGAEEEKEESIKEVEKIESRDIREAGNGKRAAKKRKTEKKARRKSNKNSRKKNRRKSGKKLKKMSQKKKRKSEKKKTKKSKKKGRKSKKNSRKVKGKKKGSIIRSSTCLNYTCIDEAISYLKLLKDKVGNFEKQHGRIKRQNKTGSGKSGKKGLFGPVVRRIVENGGGNASNLTCNGKKNSGAAQLTNLTETLLKCEDEIHMACHPGNLPQPNMTEVATCNEAMTTFKNKTAACIKKSGSDACTCWDDPDIATAATTIRKCDLSSHSKNFAKALKNCTNAFGKCRKYEDDVAAAVHACNLNSDVLVKKLKNLKKNSAALTSLQSKLDAAATRRTVRDAQPRALSCSAVITTSTTIVSMVTQNPVAYAIFTLIQTVVTVTFTCTATEKTQIKSVSASVSTAIVHVQLEVTHIQTTLVLLTGSMASDDDIEAATECKSDDECEAAAAVESPSPSPTPSSPTPAPIPSSPTPTPTPSSPTPAPTPASPTPAPTPASPTPAPTPSAPTPSPTPSSPAPTPDATAPTPDATTPAVSQQTPVSMTGPTSPGTPVMMTTGSSTRRARRYVEHLMRKRMIQTLV